MYVSGEREEEGGALARNQEVLDDSSRVSPSSEDCGTVGSFRERTIWAGPSGPITAGR